MSSLNEIIEIFERAKNDEHALQMGAYMKHHFKFLGLKKPLRSALQKQWLKDKTNDKSIDWPLVLALYSLEHREYQYLALDYLIKQKKYLSRDDLNILRQLAVEKSWWDTIDLIASHLIGHVCLDAVAMSTMFEWSQDDNVWIRRCAILVQLKYKSSTNTDVLAQVIENNLGSHEFFINKAIGWALREYSKTNPTWVQHFVNQHDLSSLSVKESLKHIKKIAP